jgi:hypothetical protein
MQFVIEESNMLSRFQEKVWKDQRGLHGRGGVCDLRFHE